MGVLTLEKFAAEGSACGGAPPLQAFVFRGLSPSGELAFYFRKRRPSPVRNEKEAIQGQAPVEKLDDVEKLC